MRLPVAIAIAIASAFALASAPPAFADESLVRDPHATLIAIERDPTVGPETRSRLGARLQGAGDAPREERAWYGWQTAGLDAVSVIGLEVGAHASTGGQTPMLLGAGLFLLGGPITHLAHGRYGAAAASLGLRVLGPLIGFGLGRMGSNGADPLILGTTIGVIGAATLDAVLLGWETTPAPRARGAASATGTWSIAPWVDRTRAGVAVGGVF